MKAQPFNFRDLATNSADVVTAVAAGKMFVPSGGRASKEEAVADAPPPAPTFSEDDLKKAEMDGYKKGFVEGTKEGIAQAKSEQAEIDKSLLEKTEGFIQAITPLFLSYEKMAMEMRRSMPQIALAVARKALSDKLPESTSQIIEELSLRALQDMIDEPKLSITVHASLADTLRGKMSDALTNLNSSMQVLVLPSDSLDQADCRIEWAGGCLERDMDVLWKRIEKVIDDMSLCAQREVEAEVTELKAQLPLDETQLVQAAGEEPQEHPNAQDNPTTDKE